MKTKNVDGSDPGAADFAFVGDENDPSTWTLPVHTEAHVRDALDSFSRTPPAEIPTEHRIVVAKRLLTAAKKFGIDAGGFATKHGLKASEADAAYTAAHTEAEGRWPGDAVRQHRFAERAAKRLLRGNSIPLHS